MIKLGQEVKDIVSGFKGIATARTEWLYGCVRVTVQSKKCVDGKPLEQTFDEDGLKVIGGGVLKASKITGGNRDFNSKKEDIRR